jgi:hypothetical protein
VTSTSETETEVGEWLPSHCPHWCDGEHATALAEGCSWEDSQEHRGGGGGDLLMDIRNPVSKRLTRGGGASWEMGLRQRPGTPDNAYCDEPRVVLEASAAHHRHTELHLTSGEARSLAAQLIANADILDLPAAERRRG